MTSGVQKASISGRYPVNILDIRMLDSVETWPFSSIFQVFYSLTTIHRYLSVQYIQQILFNILLKSDRYLIEIWSIFSCYLFITSNIRLISLISWVQISSKVLPLVKNVYSDWECRVFRISQYSQDKFFFKSPLKKNIFWTPIPATAVSKRTWTC